VEGTLFFQEVVARIQEVFRVPPGAPSRGVKIEVILDKSGKVIHHKIVEGSGDPIYDQSALSAVYRATLPPPPAHFSTPLRLTLHLLPP
jgi:TonB family protein